MKKGLFIGFCFSVLIAAAQPQQERKWVFGIHGGFNQYWGELGNGWYANDQAAYSFGGLSVSRMLNRNLDVTLFGSRGELGYQKPWENEVEQRGFRLRKTTIQLFATYYLLGRERFFQPFVFAGGGLLFQRPLGDSFYPNQKAFDYALPSGGAGFNLRLTRWMRLQFREIFIYTSADYVDYHEGGSDDLYVMHTAGLIFNVPRFNKDRNEGPDLIVDNCTQESKNRAAKRAAKKQMKTKSRMERKTAKE